MAETSPDVVVERDDSMLFGEATATFSPCGTWRYNLVRRWADGPLLRFVLLNPSTADHLDVDPTVRRCLGRAERLGYAGLLVQNVFAYRSTDPKGLQVFLDSGGDPIGPLNDAFLADPGEDVGATVAGWGPHAALLDRGAAVHRALTGAGRQLQCLAVTKDGYPGHPLYIASGTPLRRYEPTGAAAGRAS